MNDQEQQGTELTSQNTQIAPSEDMFNAKSVVNTLERLMNEVTKEDVTSGTVNAACNCAARITDLLRVHLEAKRLDNKTR